MNSWSLAEGGKISTLMVNSGIELFHNYKEGAKQAARQ